MKINGLMIDCSRLMEKHSYYFSLIDFMSQWKMNTLLLHFTDDFGCAIRLPGFSHLAMPNAFTITEIQRLVRYARMKGIQIIPELETFGHTRFITDVPRYARLFAGKKTRSLEFDAIDPLDPETMSLMKSLIRKTASLFPSKFIHIGCDEVDMRQYCKERGLNETEVWTDYVNQIAGMAYKCGKIPMMWADHPVHSQQIAEGLRKDIIMVHWEYRDDLTDAPIRCLRKAGFRDIIVAPSLGCWHSRFLPNRVTLKNTRLMSAFAHKHKAMGLINTLWCPWRYLQDAMYYGIALSSELVRAGGKVSLPAFHRRWVQKTFGTGMPAALHRFLLLWPEMHIPREIYRVLAAKKTDLTKEQIRYLQKINGYGKRLLQLADKYQPRKNISIWNSMVLAARCVWLCSEYVVLKEACPQRAERIRSFNDMLKKCRSELDAEWDRTRYPDDPAKKHPAFPDMENEYILVLMSRLSYLK